MVVPTQAIKSYFEDRTLFVLPRADIPVTVNPSGAYGRAIANLRSLLMTLLRPKTIGGVACTGEMMATMLEQGVRMINNQGNVAMVGVVRAVMDGECLRLADELFGVYNRDMLSVSQVCTAQQRLFRLLADLFSRISRETTAPSTRGIRWSSIRSWRAMLRGHKVTGQLVRLRPQTPSLRRSTPH